MIFLEGGLDWKGVVNFWRGFKVFRDSNYKFYFMTLDLLFTCRLKDLVSLGFFHLDMFLPYFV